MDIHTAIIQVDTYTHTHTQKINEGKEYGTLKDKYHMQQHKNLKYLGIILMIYMLI